AKLGHCDNPLLTVAKNLEELALQDEFFIERKLFSYVDFYSGIILKAMGIPEDMFTAIFSLARTSGWISQWIEMVNDP
ncbi:citrate/2-methylcitrate synthase, partial [Francisella tularensis]|uniref:citrate/2-methylcitrate synthase n=1 Tax=Francisella tularensis TaxID=263 RepID=UPI002381A599